MVMSAECYGRTAITIFPSLEEKSPIMCKSSEEAWYGEREIYPSEVEDVEQGQ